MMITSGNAFSFKKIKNSTDWRLLIFLILFMDVKLAIKFPALLLLFFLQPDLRLGLRFKNSRLPLFYPIAAVVTLFNFFLYRNFSPAYTAVACTGIFFWVVSLLAVHQIKLFTERTDTRILKNTLEAFFIINIAVSCIDLFFILAEIGIRNPFHYQGQYQKYFINTGDHIKGLLFDVSTTNAVINCFGIIYFLYQKKYTAMIACMIILILTASNVSNIILLFVFTGLFIIRSTRAQKSIMVVCIMLLVIFLARLSPQNNNYLKALTEKFVLREKTVHTPPVKIIQLRDRPDSLLTPEEKKEKAATLFLDSLEAAKTKKTAAPVVATESRPELPKDSIHTPTFQWKRDTTPVQRQMLSYVKKREDTVQVVYDNNLPGKILAGEQSYRFMKSHPQKLITGAGAGNFSSKLAFRATGLNISGGFPGKFIYCDPDFLINHLDLYTYFFVQNASVHSVINNPASVYDQLLTEYGIAGLLAFAVYYVGFFLRHRKKLSFGWPLLFVLLSVFTVDYWFEQLSVVVLFELMMFIDIKAHTSPDA